MEEPDTRPNLARPPGPIPTMAEVTEACGGLCRALSIGGALREKAGDLCDLIRRSPVYIGDDRAATVLEVERQLGRPLAPLWITPAGTTLMPKPRRVWAGELDGTPYGPRP